MPAKMVKLHYGTLICNDFIPYRAHVSEAWSENSFDKIKTGHRLILKLSVEDPVFRNAIKKHAYTTQLNREWNELQTKFAFLCSICDGMESAFANKTLLDSCFSIFNLEMNPNPACI